MTNDLLFSPRVQSHLHATYLFDQHTVKGPKRSLVAFHTVGKMLKEAVDGTWKNLTAVERVYVQEHFDGELEKARVQLHGKEQKKAVFFAPGMRAHLEAACV